jgi:hypothetical protein
MLVSYSLLFESFNAVSIDQLWQSLYGPDLVAEYLSGDENHEVEAALRNAELSKILDSGPPPLVDIVLPNGDRNAPTRPTGAIR